MEEVKAAKKPAGFFSMIHAALFSPDVAVDNKKPPPKKDGVDGRALWTNLICGIRPLHHPNLDEAEPLTPRPTPLPVPATADDTTFHDESAAVDEGMCSRYASAVDLRSLDKDGGEEISKGVRGSIDVKADEFIAKFYEQMRLQRVDSMDKS